MKATVTINPEVAEVELDVDHMRAFYAARGIDIVVGDKVGFVSNAHRGANGTSGRRVTAKTCIQCDRLQPIDRFYQHESHRPDGTVCKGVRDRRCMDCDESNRRECPGCGVMRLGREYVSSKSRKRNAVCFECQEAKRRRADAKREGTTEKACMTCGEVKKVSDFKVSGKGRVLWTCLVCENLEERCCTRCGQCKPIAKFWQESGSVGGRRRQCADCINEMREARRARKRR